MFTLPAYTAPDFTETFFIKAPSVRTMPAPMDGVVPENFYATTIYPEYFKIHDTWQLMAESRMDCVVVIANDQPNAIEFRNVKKGDAVVVGRHEDGGNGVYVDHFAFRKKQNAGDNFSFRTSNSRETAYSRDYDRLYQLLEFERDNGYILWVLGPAVTFDQDSRNAMTHLVEMGYVDALFAGNALATHDLESHFFNTALGQDIYSKENKSLGHYHHIETINRARGCGSLENLIEKYKIADGIVSSCIKNDIPMVLAGSIRDDGPLPGVYADVYSAQDALRVHTKKATTIICLATQLHTIATGNMTPSYQVVDGVIRPVYFYTVDISEFVVNKLKDRGSLSSKSIITNIQDFVVNLQRNLSLK
jgi:lysine-ketoglutarate reductase/saccharopine dehydrogenase-like protein (TIGR00300 family)